MKRLLILSMFLSLWGMGANAQDDKCDVNGDGVVNINDVIYVVDHILGKEHPITPTEEAGEAIDLGLPSGTKWANYNVGATKPEEYGGYYAWGETEEKEVYSEDTYIYYKISDDEYVNIGSDISGTKYDVDHVKWGGNWVMPTLDDIKELLDNCTSEWTTLNGVNGMKFTSKINGNSIFLPAAGYRWNDEFDYVGTDGFYWSSTRTPDGSYSAYNLYFFSGLALWYYSGTYRGYGQSVRPVVRN